MAFGLWVSQLPVPPREGGTQVWGVLSPVLFLLWEPLSFSSPLTPAQKQFRGRGTVLPP